MRIWYKEKERDVNLTPWVSFNFHSCGSASDKNVPKPVPQELITRVISYLLNCFERLIHVFLTHGLRQTYTGAKQFMYVYIHNPHIHGHVVVHVCESHDFIHQLKYCSGIKHTKQVLLFVQLYEKYVKGDILGI